MRSWCSSLARSSLVPALMLGSLSPGCGEPSNEPGSSTGMTLADYCQKSAELICTNLAGCCSVTREVCVDVQRSSCEESGRNAATRGLAFEAEAAQHCVAASEGLYAGCLVPSPESSNVASVCALVFTPTLEPGTSCRFDAACRGGEGLAGVCWSGVCMRVSLLANGAPCGSVLEGTCAPGAYCDGTCQPRKSMGQSCDAALECLSASCETRACGTRQITDVCRSLTDMK